MTNFTETSNLPDTDVERLFGVEPEYSVKLSGASFAVTPEAHEHYGLTPIIDVVAGGLKKVAYGNSRSPYLEAVLAAPYELPIDPEDPATQSTFYARREGVCTFWMTHPLTVQEYEERGLAESITAAREQYPHLRDVPEADIRRLYVQQGTDYVKPTLHANYVAGMVNELESLAIRQTLYMREASYELTPARLQTLQREGIRFRFTEASGEIRFEAMTTQAVINYARRRAERLGGDVFSVFSERDFAQYRTSQYPGKS